MVGSVSRETGNRRGRNSSKEALELVRDREDHWFPVSLILTALAPLPPLRVVAGSPAPLPLSSGRLAARDVDGLGGRSLSVYTRCRLLWFLAVCRSLSWPPVLGNHRWVAWAVALILVVAYGVAGDRSPLHKLCSNKGAPSDPILQLPGVLLASISQIEGGAEGFGYGTVGSVDPLSMAACRYSSCAAPSSMSPSPSQVSLSMPRTSCGGELPAISSVPPPWCRPRMGSEFGTGFFNKLGGARLLGVLPRSSCRGGSGGGKIQGSGAPGINREALLRSSSTEVMIADVICGQGRPLRAVVFSWHYSFFCEPSRRIFGFSMAQHAGLDPSGVVPGVVVGGHASRPCQRCGEDEGPDCFFDFTSRVLFAYAEGQVVICIFLTVLFVTCSAA